MTTTQRALGIGAIVATVLFSANVPVPLRIPKAVESPKKFDGAEVEIVGEYLWGFEHSLLRDESCKPGEPNCTAWIEFHECTAVRQGKTQGSCGAVIGDIGTNTGKVRARMRGRLRTIRRDIRYDKSMPRSVRIGFGHLGAYPVLLEVHEMEIAEACCGAGDTLAATTSATIRTFLRSYLRRPNEEVDQMTRYVAAYVTLKRGGEPQVIVYFTDAHSCGSGGCQTLILDRVGDSYRVVTPIAIGRLPIRRLPSESHGWRDLAIWVRGGGIVPGYEAVLSFDGTTYPTNPSVPPAHPLQGVVQGEVVMTGDEAGVPLYGG